MFLGDPARPREDFEHLAGLRTCLQKKTANSANKHERALFGVFMLVLLDCSE